MSTHHLKQKGITLLEMILSLAIAMTSIVLGMRLYSQYEFQLHEAQLLGNVNQLFQAMKSYYQANCRQSLSDTSTAQSAGTLDPLVAGNNSSVTAKVLNITTDLVTPGFILARAWHPNNPLVNNGTYIVQFNRTYSGGLNPTMGFVACTGTGTSPCYTKSGGAIASTSAPSVQSSVATWTAQVSVQLASHLTHAQWTQIMNDLNAQCISTLSGSSVLSCKASPAQTGYVVWQRNVMQGSLGAMSRYWSLDPSVKEFNMQYTNDPLAGFSGVSNETGTWYNAQSYLCGG